METNKNDFGDSISDRSTPSITKWFNYFFTDDFSSSLHSLDQDDQKKYDKERWTRNIRFSLFLGWGACTFELVQGFITYSIPNFFFKLWDPVTFSLLAIPYFLISLLGYYLFYNKKDKLKEAHRYLLFNQIGWLFFSNTEDVLNCTGWSCPQSFSNTFFIAVMFLFAALTLQLREIKLGLILAALWGVVLSYYLAAPNINVAYLKLISCILLLGAFRYRYITDVENYNRRHTIIRQAEALKKADELKTNLYTNITHEFRTPLTVIQGMVTEMPIKTKGRDIVLRNTQQLLLMVNQMLDLAKLESGSMPIKYVQDDIISFLHYQTDSWSFFAKSKNIHLNFFSRHGPLIMDLNKHRLHQIMTNLLSNAIKFTPEHGKIKVVVEQVSNDVELLVIDTGPGIPNDQLPYIFDRFYQLDSSSTRQGEGTGIGLALVKELVQLMNGTITVTSKKEIGTTFKVLLPIKNNGEKLERTTDFYPPLPIPSFPPKPQMQATINLTKKQSDLPRLLIIEDNYDVIIYLENCLKGGYQIQKAINGIEGIKLAQKEIPDIILCDVMMPKLDGFEVCRILKSERNTCHIPIILLTAKATEEAKIEGLMYGADAYLTKPFNKQELLVRLRQLIDLRKKLHTRIAKDLAVNTVEQNLLSDKDRQFLEKLTTYIKENLANENLEVIYMQKAVDMSRGQLHKKLKALTGLSASQFRKGIRLQEANRLLLGKEDFTISEIAYQVGYKHVSHFSRDYKGLFGRNPSELKS